MEWSRIYMLIGALLLSGLFVLPVWNITLEAPQYPEPIGMNIYINKFKGAGDNDIQNINIMNHYVGMKEIPEEIPEFTLFPYFVAGMILLGLVFALIGKRRLYILWFILMVILGSIAMYDFYSWEYDYGHNLKENAAIKFTDKEGNPMNYQPPLIGAKTILNFRAISMPRIGTYVLILGMIFSLVAFWRARREMNLITILLLLMFTVSSCEVKPGKIHYGSDACDFCQMTIVDKQHAAQLVTEKGRIYKYDAIECMLSALKRWDRPPVAYYLVADYTNPGELTPASDAHFLISEEIPSPMGANLTAFSSASKRKDVLGEVNGEFLAWEQLKKEYNLTE